MFPDVILGPGAGVCIMPPRELPSFLAALGRWNGTLCGVTRLPRGGLQVSFRIPEPST